MSAELSNLVKELHTTSNLELVQDMKFSNVVQIKDVQTRYSNINKKPIQRFIKNIIDYCATLIGLVLISPFLILIAALIKLDSPGPILYKQLRVGKYNKKFYMYKFRSMEVNADKNIDKLKNQNETNELMFKMKNDPRVTKIGAFIRKYSIDELPQLINVLRGEMSLVGPRPPLPSEVEQYKLRHHLRLATQPGLTGLWQVSGRSSITCFDQVVDLDIKYIRYWNLLFDFEILFKTIPVVLLGKNFQ